MLGLRKVNDIMIPVLEAKDICQDSVGDALKPIHDGGQCCIIGWAFRTAKHNEGVFDSFRYSLKNRLIETFKKEVDTKNIVQFVFDNSPSKVAEAWNKAMGVLS